jgi:hypothetical protein
MKVILTFAAITLILGIIGSKLVTPDNEKPIAAIIVKLNGAPAGVIVTNKDGSSKMIDPSDTEALQVLKRIPNPSGTQELNVTVKTPTCHTSDET